MRNLRPRSAQKQREDAGEEGREVSSDLIETHLGRLPIQTIHLLTTMTAGFLWPN